MKRLLTVLALCCALLSGGAEKLRIADATGSDGNAVTAGLLKLAAGRSDIEISLTRLDAESALEKLDAGDFDVVLVNGGDLPQKYRAMAFRYATGACIACVNAQNPLRRISLKDLRMVLDAPRPNWELVSGSASDIHRCGIADRDGRLIGAELLKLPARAREMLFLSTMKEAMLIAGDDPAVLIWGPFTPEIPLTVVPLAVDGVAPTRANIRNGSYPLSVSRFAVSSAAPGKAAQEFLAMLRSGEFARFVEEDGELPELPASRP